MARPLRVRFRSVSIPLAILFLLTAAPAFPSGFQLNTQGARAMGMGLAFTAVANDPSAIFFNPAGLGWQKSFDVEIGSSFITKTQGDFSGEDPFPGIGNSEKQHKTTFTLPTLYVVAPLTTRDQFRTGDLLAVRPRVPLGQRRGLRRRLRDQSGQEHQLLGPLHQPERGHPDGGPEPCPVFPGDSVPRDRRRRRLPGLQGAAREEPGGDQSLHQLGRGRRAHQAEQRPDGQPWLGMERGHPLPPGPAVLLRRRLPEQDQDRLRGDRHIPAAA